MLKYVVFTGDGEGAFALSELLKDTDAHVIAVSFPYKQSFRVPDGAGGVRDALPGTSNPDVARRLESTGISLIRGNPPLTDSFFIPGVKDPKLEGIRYALQLISGGLHLCIQAVAMATDAGALEPGDEVVSMSADTAIVATAASARLLFHPEFGMEVREIICKPRYLTSRGTWPEAH